MTSNKRYEKYRFNQTVIDRAVWAFEEYFWQRDGVGMPDGMKEHVRAAMDATLRAATNAGRSNGWFDRNDIPEGENQSYKVHLFSGEGEAPPPRASKYGLHLMQEGSSYLVECADLPKLRAAVTSYAKDHGMAFTVNKHPGGALVTRHQNPTHHTNSGGDIVAVK